MGISELYQNKCVYNFKHIAHISSTGFVLKFKKFQILHIESMYTNLATLALLVVWQPVV